MAVIFPTFLTLMAIASQAAWGAQSKAVRLDRMPATAMLLAHGGPDLQRALWRDSALAGLLLSPGPVIAVPAGKDIYLIPRDVHADSLMISLPKGRGEPRLARIGDWEVAELKEAVAHGDFPSAYALLRRRFDGSAASDAQGNDFVSAEFAAPRSAYAASQASKVHPLIIIGEFHNDPNHNTIRNRLIAAALTGEIELGLEGATAANSTALTSMLAAKLRVRTVKGARIRGIETEEVHVLTGLVKLRHLFYRDEAAATVKTVLDRIFLPMFDTYPSARRAWLEARKHQPGDMTLTGADKNLDFIDVYAQDPDKRDRMRQLLARDEAVSSTEWNMVLYHFAFQYADYIRRALGGFGGRAPEKGFSKKLKDALLYDADKLVVKWRNQYLVSEIAHVYEASLRSRRPAVVIVGARHLDGLKSLVRRHLPGVFARFVDLGESDPD